VALVTVLSKPDCHLCERAMADLRRLQGELSFELQELCEYFLDEAELRKRLESRR